MIYLIEDLENIDVSIPDSDTKEISVSEKIKENLSKEHKYCICVKDFIEDKEELKTYELYDFSKRKRNIAVSRRQFVKSDVQKWLLSLPKGKYSLILEYPYPFVAPVHFILETGEFSSYGLETEITREFQQEIESIVSSGYVTLEEDGRLLRTSSVYNGMIYTTFLNFLDSAHIYTYFNYLFWFWDPKYLQQFRDVYICDNPFDIVTIEIYLKLYDFDYEFLNGCKKVDRVFSEKEKNRLREYLCSYLIHG